VLAVAGGVTLDGTLVARLLAGFTPAVGQSFEVLTAGSDGVQGTFSSLVQPTGATVQATYDPADVTLGDISVAPPSSPPYTGTAKTSSCCGVAGAGTGGATLALWAMVLLLGCSRRRRGPSASR
jgi:hypothetical protein